MYLFVNERFWLLRFRFFPHLFYWTLLLISLLLAKKLKKMIICSWGRVCMFVFACMRPDVCWYIPLIKDCYCTYLALRKWGAYNAIPYNLIAKCQYNYTRNVLWYQAHSSRIRASHKTSLNYSNRKHRGKNSLIKKYMRNPTDVKLYISLQNCLFVRSTS